MRGSQGVFTFDRVAEARGLAEQLVVAMNICKQRHVVERVSVGHTTTHYSFHNEIFFVSVWGEVARVEGRYGCVVGIRVDDVNLS